MTQAQPEPSPNLRRGFAALSPERRREIASMGGKTAHALGRAHQYTSEEAREAGRKGGLARHHNKRPGTIVLGG